MVHKARHESQVRVKLLSRVDNEQLTLILKSSTTTETKCTPKAAVGLDIGEGVVVRYDEQAKEVVGLTIVGVGRRLEEYVKSKP